MPNGGITVFIREGNYEYPKSGLKFTYDDSGTKQAPITYRAYRNEKVSLIGGIRLDIKDFKKVTDEKLLSRIYDEKARGNIFECNLSKYAKDYDIGGSGYVEIEKTGRNVQNQLICDDKQMVLSEFPNRVNGEPSWVNIYEDVENGKSFRLAPELSDRVNNWKKSDWGKMTVYGPVGTAVALGGPGALVWMWISALFGMTTKFSECMLAVKYREVSENGDFTGGPMYTLKNGLGKKTGCDKIGKLLGGSFAISTIIASFGIGNMTQSSSIPVKNRIKFMFSVLF